MTAYRYVRLGRLPARKSGGQWRVRPADLAAVAAGEEPAPGRRGRPRWERHRDRLLARLVAGDEAGAWAVAEAALVAGASPRDVYLEVLAPAMVEVGRRWEAGTLDVGGEHRATAVALRLVGRLGPRFAKRGRRRGTVVVGAPDGDHHSLPAAILSDVLRGEGYEVVDLGGATPAASFVTAGREAGGDLVAFCISAGTSRAERAVRSTVARLHAELPGTPVLVGGPAVRDEAIARRLGADGWAPDAQGAARLLAALPGAPRA